MGTIVAVLRAPVCYYLAGIRHVSDDLLRGGTEVLGPAVNEGYFYEPRDPCHDSPKVFERGLRFFRV